MRAEEVCQCREACSCSLMAYRGIIAEIEHEVLNRVFPVVQCIISLEIAEFEPMLIGAFVREFGGECTGIAVEFAKMAVVSLTNGINQIYSQTNAQ